MFKTCKEFSKKRYGSYGIGRINKSMYSGFDFKKWQENYRNSNIKVVCRVSIEKTALLGKVSLLIFDRKR